MKAKKSPAQKTPPGAFTAAEHAALTAQKERNSSRTPKVVLDALFPNRIDVARLPLRPLSLGDFILLEKLDSPILDLDSDEEREIGPADFAAAVYLLATPFEQVAEQLTANRSGFDASSLAFAARVPAGELFTIGQKIRAALRAGFATAISGGEKKTPVTPASAGV